MQVEIAEIKRDIKHIREMLEHKCAKIDKHVDESTEIRMQVHDNTMFKNGATRALWVIYTAVIGLFIKVIFFK